MLFILRPDLIHALPRLLASERARIALSNVARAHREGKHFVTGSSRVLRQVAEDERLPQETRGTFREVHANHAFDGALRELVSCYVEVVPPRGGDEALVQRRRDAGGKQVLSVPLAYFEESSQTQLARLVAEDWTDANVYRCIAAAFRARHVSGENVAIRFEPLGGGGSSTADAYIHHAGHAPTLCIVDGDLRFRGSGPAPEGDTAKAARKADQSIESSALAMLHVLPCRELENLLPSVLVREATATYPAHVKDEVEALISLRVIDGGTDTTVVDLKKGICRWDVLAVSGEERRHLEQLWSHIAASKVPPERGFCGENARCMKRDRCECSAFSGLGDGLLENVLRCLTKMSPQKLGELFFGSSTREEVNELGALLFSWGAGHKRLRS